MFQGEIQTFPLPDVLQWLGQNRSTGELTLRDNGRRIVFYFDGGDIAAATSTEIVGADDPEEVLAVLSSALAWKSGRFIFEKGALPQEILSANIHLRPVDMLLKSALRLDRQRDVSFNAADANGEGYSETFTLADDLRLKVVDRLLRGNFQVPPMPQLAARVLDLTRNTDFSLRDLGDLILTDQAIAAEVLRYANSALYGAERRVDTLAIAVQRLGSDEVVQIVFAASLRARHRGRDIFAEQKQELWLHSSTAAFFARTIAARVKLAPGLGFLCGLLMDFGMSVLYSVIQEILSHDTAPMSVISEIVRDYHPRIGRVVGEKWNLPPAVIESMAYHHCLADSQTDSPYVAVASLTESLVTFVLDQPRETLAESLAEFPRERLCLHPGGKRLRLSLETAAMILKDLPQQLDLAQQFID